MFEVSQVLLSVGVSSLEQAGGILLTPKTSPALTGKMKLFS